MKKKSKISIEELTKNEILRIETEDKISKYEKEIAKYKRTISNLKEKDKLYAKALSLCENKINLIKDSSLDNLLFLCENIKDIKNSFYNECEKIDDEALKGKFLLFADEYDFILNKLYDVCNKIEEESFFSRNDKQVFPNKFEMSDLSKFDNYEQFNEIRNELRKNISRKNNKDNNDVSNKNKSLKENFGFEDVEEEDNDSLNDALITEKFNKIFYERPEMIGFKSNIESNEDSSFDFNEALNPTLSLNDIMKDLMSLDEENDDLDEITTTSYNKEDAMKMRQERMDKIGSKMSSNQSKITRRDTGYEDFEDFNDFQDSKNLKDNYDKKFTELQNKLKNNI